MCGGLEQFQELFNPVGNKNIRCPWFLRGSVRGEDEFLPVRRKHGEAIEDCVIGQPLQSRAVSMYDIQLEIMSESF